MGQRLRARIPPRRRLEPGLAIVVLVLGAMWFSGIQLPVEAFLVYQYGFLAITFLLPALFALVVLTGAVGYAIQVGRELVTSQTEPQAWPRVLVRVLLATVFGGIAAYTLLLAVLSVYGILFIDPGGVLLQPFIVLGIASILSVLVLVRWTGARLVEGGQDAG